MMRRSMRFAPVLVAACCWLTTAPAEAASILLLDALEQLRSEGHRITYSSELVRATARIDIGTVTLQSVRDALPPLGLALERSGELWLVVPGPVVPVPPSSSNADTPAVPRQAESETVIVTGTRHRFASASRDTGASILGEELRAIPALASDSLRGANRLPGMSSVGVSARPRIRGGLEDETLVLLDGVELLDPYHGTDFQSLLSAIDDRLVETMDIYAGGFPARFGNRLSGAVDVRTARDSESSSAVGLSTISAVANARRTMGDDASLVGSLRRGNLDTIADRVNSQLGEPRYLDAYARGRWRVAPTVRIESGLLGITDDILLKDERDSAQSNVETGYWWTRLETERGRTAFGQTLLSAVVSLRSREAELRDADGTLESYLDIRQTYREASLRSDWTTGRHESLRTELGLEWHVADVSYDSLAFADREELSPLTGDLAPDDHDLHVRADGTWGGMYTSLDIELGAFTLQPGLRLDAQHYSGNDFEAQVSPRLGARWTFDDSMYARFDLGRFHQPELLHELPVADGADEWTKAQRSDHVSVALERSTARDSVRVEVYAKRYNDVKRRFENLFDPFVLAPELEGDRVSIDPGHGFVRGADAEVRHAFGDETSVTLRYGYLDANERVASAWLPRRWSQRHTLNAILRWQTEHTVLTGAITWHSGWRTAAPPDAIAVGTTVPIDDLLNNTELSSYLSIDLGMRRSWRIGRSELTLFADLTNVTNRDNDAGVDYDVETVGDILTFTPDNNTLLPIVPSIGVLLEF